MDQVIMTQKTTEARFYSYIGQYLHLLGKGSPTQQHTDPSLSSYSRVNDLGIFYHRQ